MTHHRSLSIAPVAIPLLLAALVSSPRAQPPDASRPATDREVHQLKMAYLRCGQAATERLLDFGDAASCSAIHERLLKVGFGDDFRRLLAWWHAERVAEAHGERITTP